LNSIDLEGTWWTEQRKVDQFEDGIDIEILKGLSFRTFTKYWEIHQRAIRAETMINKSRAKNSTTKKSGKGNPFFSKQKGITQEQGGMTTYKTYCEFC